MAITPGMPSPFDEMIRVIADRYGLEYALVKAVIKAESGFNHLAVSRKGAQGLMQLMPDTAAEVRVQDAFTPQDNIEGGVKYLRRLLDRYDGNLALAVAAYNAGPMRVDEVGGIPDIAETCEYLARVLRYRLGYLRESAGVARPIADRRPDPVPAGSGLPNLLSLRCIGLVPVIVGAVLVRSAGARSPPRSSSWLASPISSTAGWRGVTASPRSDSSSIRSPTSSSSSRC